MKEIKAANPKISYPVSKSSKDKVSALVFQPLKSGLFGFAIFFTILAVSKVISYLFFGNDYIIISLDDAAISLVGFVLVFSMKILEKNLSRF
jgi:hypothetical protein